MKNGKIFISILLVLAIVLSFVGCGKSTDDETTTQPTSNVPVETVFESVEQPPVTEYQTEATTQAPTEAPTETPTVPAGEKIDLSGVNSSASLEI